MRINHPLHVVLAVMLKASRRVCTDLHKALQEHVQGCPKESCSLCTLRDDCSHLEWFLEGNGNLVDGELYSLNDLVEQTDVVDNLASEVLTFLREKATAAEMRRREQWKKFHVPDAAEADTVA
jgi:hypothetical protein